MVPLASFADELTKIAISPLASEMAKSTLFGMGFEALLNRDATPLTVAREGVGFGVGEVGAAALAKGMGYGRFGQFAAGMIGGTALANTLRKRFADKPVQRAVDKLPDTPDFNQVKEAGAIKDVARAFADGAARPVMLPIAGLLDAAEMSQAIRKLRSFKNVDKERLAQVVANRREALGWTAGTVALPGAVAALAYGLGNHNQVKEAGVIQGLGRAARDPIGKRILATGGKGALIGAGTGAAAGAASDSEHRVRNAVIGGLAGGVVGGVGGLGVGVNRQHKIDLARISKRRADEATAAADSMARTEPLFTDWLADNVKLQNQEGLYREALFSGVPSDVRSRMGATLPGLADHTAVLDKKKKIQDAMAEAKLLADELARRGKVVSPDDYPYFALRDAIEERGALHGRRVVDKLLGREPYVKISAALKSILTPQSSNVSGYSYDPATQALNVTYKGGGTYTYQGVSAKAVKALKRNKSVGKTINKLRQGLEYEKVGSPQTATYDFKILAAKDLGDGTSLKIAHRVIKQGNLDEFAHVVTDDKTNAMRAMISYKHHPKAPLAELSGLHVDPTHRRKGYAKLLVQSAQEGHPTTSFAVHPEPWKDESVSVESLKTVYRKLGFKPAERGYFKLDPLTKTAKLTAFGEDHYDEADDRGWKDKMPGGAADDKFPTDFDFDALDEGMKHELEHTKDRRLAMEIAMDHLAEDKDYYAKLKKMEKQADMLVGDKDGKYVHSIGIFVDGDEADLGRLRDLVREHGSVQAARSAYQAEHPNQFVTLSAVRRSQPLTGKPVVHLQAGKPGTNAQTSFYNDVFKSGGLSANASFGNTKPQGSKVVPVVGNAIRGGAAGALTGAFSSLKSGKNLGRRSAIGGAIGATLGAGYGALSRPKTASEDKDKTWTEDDEYVETLKAETGGLGAQLALSGAMYPIASKWVKEDVPTSVARTKAMAKAMGLPHEGTEVIRGDAAFDPSATRGKRVAGPTLHLPARASREAIIAHELGHYKNSLKFSPTYHKIQNISRVLTGGVRGRFASGAVAGQLAAATETPSYIPAALGALVAAPTLFEEAAASARATRHMMKAHGSVRGLARSLGLLPALATYTAPVAIPALITRMRNKYREETGATKEDRMTMGWQNVSQI